MSAGRFEAFVVEQLVQWLAPRITAGFRYQFRSPDTAITHRLMSALHHHAVGSLPLYGTDLPYLGINGVKLIYVAHVDSQNTPDTGFNENYISMLRDEVASQQGPLAGCALLIMHNSLLDTLITTAENLAAPGAVWSPVAIHAQLAALINGQSKPSRVFRCLLDYQANILREDCSSMFGFEPLYQAIASGDALDLRALGLFRDRGLAEMTNDHQIQRRLQENRQLHEDIETVVHHFPEELEERLSYFSEDFLKVHFRPDSAEPWQDLDLQDLWTEIEAQKQKAVDFAAASSETCQVVGPRNKSETVAGKREKHLVLLARAHSVTFDLQLLFYGQDLEPRQFRVSNNKWLEVQATLDIRRTRGKRLVTLTGPFSGPPSYFTLRLRRPRAPTPGWDTPDQS
jgi:DNA phosphorothioation-dependent restriction protein DptH